MYVAFNRDLRQRKPIFSIIAKKLQFCRYFKKKSKIGPNYPSPLYLCCCVNTMLVDRYYNSVVSFPGFSPTWEQSHY